MPEARLAIAERPIRAMCFGVFEVVLAADDVADLHLLVVDHHHEVVERRAIRAHDDEVAEQAVVELDLAADQVVEAHHLGRHLEADRRLSSLGAELRAVRIGQGRQRPL